MLEKNKIAELELFESKQGLFLKSKKVVINYFIFRHELILRN